MSTLCEERAQVKHRAEITEQVLTLSAVNQSAITPDLIETMLQEAAKLEDLVSKNHN